MAAKNQLLLPKVMKTSVFRRPVAFKRLSIGLAVFLLGGVVLAYYSLPQYFKTPLLQLNRATAGLSVYSVSSNGHTLRYLDGGRGETLVLLHGIFAEKDHWVDFARPLTPHFRVLAPDLPGFGESTRLPDKDYSYAEQVVLLKEFLDHLGVRRAHLGGSSMGGTIATLFAIRYPERVASVALIGAPHGLHTPQPSAMDPMVDAGKSPLIVTESDAFEPMLDFVFAKRPFLPYPILHATKGDALRNASSNLRIWRAQSKDRYLLDAHIGELKQPTLVLWGDRDRLFDVSGVIPLQVRLPQAKVRVLHGVGHLPMMETPKAAALLYAQFLEPLKSPQAN
jgi:pimeloyl-ACP methyl ester carboxylesterase